MLALGSSKMLFVCKNRGNNLTIDVVPKGKHIRRTFHLFHNPGKAAISRQLGKPFFECPRRHRLKEIVPIVE